MSTRAQTHTHTQIYVYVFEIETSLPSNQIYARLVFRARRIWTKQRASTPAAASDLSLVEREATFLFFEIPLDFFILAPYTPPFIFLNNFNYRS